MSEVGTHPEPDFDSFGIYLRQIRRFPLLTAAHEAELGRRAKRGDRKAQDKLVCHNLRFVISVAKPYANSVVSGSMPLS